MARPRFHLKNDNKKKECKILTTILLFLRQLEMKQRYLSGKMNGPDEKGDGHHEEVTMETLGKKCKGKSFLLKPAKSFFFFFSDWCVFSLADMCIEKSLLLLRFPPCGPPCGGSDAPKAAEGSSAPRVHSNSISEGDFQASSSAGSPGVGKGETAQSPGAQAQNSSAGDQRMTDNKGLGENLSARPEQPAVPSATPHKTPFSRSRLRLLSCRSIEEPSMTTSVKDRYPIIKHILNFIRDQGVTTAR